ncbi:NAD synthetase [Pseudomonas sp. CDFA 602]|uniref:NAD synthetase n=1 Tax=Pseudomonas californiensis TaxID=2829823 RepID=UPI001E4E7CE2|nr:NAD synthetase [Pseudomonas californiensis]MCD5995981.1 NAD synthetase [Pseudomonas californiensis]MCD6001578.1 NAD synthetase [Pseudomonas californiensis]
MSQAMIGLNNSPSQLLARRSVEARINVQRLFATIDADPGIVGAGVVYIDSDYNVITLREFTPVCSIKPKRIILREAKRNIAPQQFAREVQTNPRESRLLYEAFSTTMSCGGAILGWIAVFGGGAAVPFTGGASLVITAIGYASTAASTAQCAIGLTRTLNEVVSPGNNDSMDSSETYQLIASVLDVVSLAGVGATGLTTVKLMQVRKAATGRSWYDLTKELNRQQRKALTKELLMLQNPKLTAKLLKLKQASGDLPTRMAPTQLKAATVLQLQDVLSMGLSLIGSSYMQSIAVGLYEEVTE